MQLAYYDALRSVNDESALRRHERDFAHINLLFLRAFFFSQLESDVQRRAVGLPFALRFQCGQFRLANVIMTKIEHRFLVIAFDWEDLLENSLEALIFPLGVRDILLQEVDVRISLNLNQIRGFDTFLDASKVNAF